MKRRERAAGAALLILAFAVYLGSPQRLALDSRFAVLTAEMLITTGGWDLSPGLEGFSPRRGTLPPRYARSPSGTPKWDLGSEPYYQLVRRGDRILYLYPPGVALLAAPLVGVARLAGLSALNENGVYSYRRELDLHALLAALFTAATALVVLRIARRELELAPALGVALAAALGSSLWSTASRVLWTHTLGALLVGLAWLELLRWEDGERRRPVWMGALLAAGFWVRPTAALVAAALTLLVALRHRAALARVVLVGAAGLAAFLAYSRTVWDAALPPYYALGSVMSLAGLHSGLAGLLVSPTRGLLVFAPVLLVAGTALAWAGVPEPRRAPARLAGALVAAHLALYASWPLWWGGGSYGPRLMTDLVPLLAWLGALAARAIRERGARGEIGAGARRALAAAAIVLALAGALAHGAGALSNRTFQALSTAAGPEGPRLWNWRFNPYSAVARALSDDEAAPARRRPARRRARPPAAPAEPVEPAPPEPPPLEDSPAPS